jgi:TRAP-type transport system small permease protein
VTFMGAVVALKERAHLGTDILLARLSLRGKKICMAISMVLMLGLCAVLFRGAWEQTKINASSVSAAMEVSMGIFFSTGLMFAVLGGLVIARDLYRLLTGQMSEAEIMAVRESEEAPHANKP